MIFFVINLDRAVDRWERIKSRAIHMNIFDKMIRFSAIDKRDSEKVTELLKTYKVPCNSSCYLSHLKVLESFLESNDEFTCVFEDDAYIINSGFTNIDSVCNDINISKDKFDVIYLSNRWRKNNKNEATTGCGTEAYMVSRKGAAKMLKLLNPSNTCIDLKMGQLHHFNKNAKLHEKSLISYVSKIQYVKHDDHGYSYLNK